MAQVFCKRPNAADWQHYTRKFRKDQAGVKRLIVGKFQKCVECRPVLVKDGKFSKLQLRNVPYKHAANCSQKERF